MWQASGIGFSAGKHEGKKISQRQWVPLNGTTAKSKWVNKVKY